MHKYAAATALAIAPITMLALAVSASLTPANAQVGRGGIPLFICNGADIRHPGPRPIALEISAYYCTRKCTTELWNTATLWDGTRNPPRSCPPSLQACVATCVAAKKVAQH
jgi:hypothetical protein